MSVTPEQFAALMDKDKYDHHFRHGFSTRDALQFARDYATYLQQHPDVSETSQIKLETPDEQQGLYRKYEVRRIADVKRKHANCEYFVLDLNHDEFSIPALRAYADACAEKFPQLAADIRHKLTAADRGASSPQAKTQPDWWREAAKEYVEGMVWLDQEPEAIERLLKTLAKHAPSPEHLAQRFHEAYERLAPKFGYKTRKESAKPWAEVPQNNRLLMIAVCAEIMRPSASLLAGASPSSPAAKIGLARDKYCPTCGNDRHNPLVNCQDRWHVTVVRHKCGHRVRVAPQLPYESETPSKELCRACIAEAASSSPEPASKKCDCGTSTGICGSITRGTGKLDDNGYWQFPCLHGNAYSVYVGSSPEPEKEK